MTQSTAQDPPRPGPVRPKDLPPSPRDLPDHGPHLEAADALPLGQRAEELTAVHASLAAVLREAQD